MIPLYQEIQIVLVHRVYLLRLSKTVFAETSQSSGFKACSMLSVYSNPMTLVRRMPWRS